MAVITPTSHHSILATTDEPVITVKTSRRGCVVVERCQPYVLLLCKVNQDARAETFHSRTNYVCIHTQARRIASYPAGKHSIFTN